MNGPVEMSRSGVTRAGLLRAVLGGSAVVAGGAATASWVGGDAPVAAPSAGTDEKILNLFLLLERVQDGFYGEVVEQGGLDGPLLEFARTVGAQERRHVALLSERLGKQAADPPQSDFGAATQDPKRFQQAAIKLEEATIAAFISQSANLTREAVAAVVPMVSVEARQVAWVRDLAGVSPAPQAADPARKSEDILAELRQEGFIT